ncbi:MAG: acyl-protein synthetase [Anaerolineaceae bacterium]|nr:acyl-protein synthetase [Anaerolineaceae bacterium]
MNDRLKLFGQRNPYDLEKSQGAFLRLMRDNISFHREHCPNYREMLDNAGFKPEDIVTEEDLARLPVIPTLYFKRNRVFSIPEDKLVIKATSSGTKGTQSQVGFDRKSLLSGILMMIRFFSYHHILSLRPTNYIILGYEPSDHTQMGAIKTAYHTTKFAPALHRAYALRDTGTGYELNIEGLQKALHRYAKQGLPVRFVGFPSHMYFLANHLKQNKIQLKLNRHSKILLGGGWKQFSNEEIDRESFYALIHETLGIEKDHYHEFFSAVEHPLPYCKCVNGHFHVPIYSRVIIRDVRTLQPVPNGQLGLLSFVSPLVLSMPIASVVTDDLAILHEGERCGCGTNTPYFDLHGRAGVSQIRTCTTDAASLLGEKSK